MPDFAHPNLGENINEADVLKVLVNEGDTSRAVDVWVTLTGPNTNRQLTRFPVTLSPGAGIVRNFTQKVPGGLAPGTYSVTGNVGAFPVAEESDSFTLTKL